MISDQIIKKTAKEIKEGLVEADYGHGVIKKRLARKNEGKSGGFRTIILYKKGESLFFVYGFSKSSRDNITRKEEEAFKALAHEVLNMSEQALGKAIHQNVFREVKINGEVL